jgi:N-acylneuraminate cytidylyltransferase
MTSSDSTEPNTIAFIFARGGSKGLPRTNQLPVAGVSLLARAIRCAKDVHSINRVIVSTDDLEIAEAARAAGAEVPFMRPPELASDSARVWQAWRHAVDFVENEPGARKIDVFVSVPPVCPLRTPHDLKRAISLYNKGNADIVFSVTPSKPYDSRVKVDSSGAASLAQAPDDAARQRTSTVYDIVGAVYVTSPDYIRQAESIWGGRNATIEIPHERAVEINTEMELRLAELLLQGGRS